MVDMRRIGCTIQKLATEHNVNNDELASMLQCDSEDVPALFKGLVYPTFEQLNNIATKFEVDIQTVVIGDNDYYKQNFVHCMTDFQDEKNKEMILDLIYSYIDVREAALN